MSVNWHHLRFVIPMQLFWSRTTRFDLLAIQMWRIIALGLWESDMCYTSVCFCSLENTQPLMARTFLSKYAQKKEKPPPPSPTPSQPPFSPRLKQDNHLLITIRVYKYVIKQRLSFSSEVLRLIKFCVSYTMNICILLLCGRADGRIFRFSTEFLCK